MESFVIRPTTWPVLRLFSRNPLMRTRDRIEAAAAALAGLLIVIAAACAGVIGTMIHIPRPRTILNRLERDMPWWPKPLTTASQQLHLNNNLHGARPMAGQRR